MSIETTLRWVIDRLALMRDSTTFQGRMDSAEIFYIPFAKSP